MVRVTAGWARLGKTPHSFQDYAVLESGGPFTADDYAAILDRYALGNPPPERTGPEALPWITLSEVQDDRHSYLGVSVQYWTDDADRAGRPIAETLYGCFPYPQLVRRPVSYWELARAVDRLGRGDPGSGDGAEVGGYAPEEHERDLRRPGWLRRAMVVAAMALEGQVTITGAGGLDVEERLRFLDAVAALLPYGWRPRFTASTWFRGGSDYIQVVFAAHSRETGFDLDWRTDPVPAPPPEAKLAARYLQELTRLIDHRRRGVLEILSYLGNRTASLAGRDPREAVEIMEEIDLPWSVLQRARQGVAQPQEVAELLDSGRYLELPPVEDHAFLLAELIRLDGPASMRVIEKVYRPIDRAASEAGLLASRREIWNALLAGARSLLREESSAYLLPDYLAMTDRIGVADELLAVLVKRASADGLPVRTLARTLARWADPAGSPRPRALETLKANPVIVCALILDEHAEARARLGAWLQALKPVITEDLARVLEALLDRAPDRPLTGEALAGVPGNCGAPLIQLAMDAGRLDALLPSMIEPILKTPGDPPVWVNSLASFIPRNSADRGALDALLLVSSAQPKYLRAAVGADHETYLGAFRLYLERLRPVLGAASDGMVDYLTQEDWATDPVWTRAVVRVVEVLCEVPELDWSGVVRAVARGRAITPWPQEYERLWSWAVGRYPQIAKEQWKAALTGLLPDASAEDIGRLAAEAVLGRATHTEIIRWILGSRVRLTATAWLDVVFEFRRALVQLGMRRADADRSAADLAESLCTGDRFGVADVFREAVAARTEWIRDLPGKRRRFHK